LRFRLIPSETRSRPRSRDSTLMTLAPMSASSIVQKGMAMTCPRSSTVTSLSAWFMYPQKAAKPAPPRR